MKSLVVASAVALAALTTSAKADDLWTGAYAGAHVGYAWGHDTVNDKASDWCDKNDPGYKQCIKDYVGPFDLSPNGVFGGGTAGYNWHVFPSVVVGVEGDIGYLNLDGTNTEAKSSVAPFHQSITIGGGLYGDITGRAGVLVTPDTLVYGKAGFVFFDGDGAKTTPKPGYATTPTDTFTGLAFGGGVEHFITRDVSIKVEFMHFNFDDQDSIQTATVKDGDTPKGYQFHNTHSLDADSVKLGIAYHW